MKKVYLLLMFLLAFTLGLLYSNNIITRAQDELTIYIHYHRFDKNYTSWDLWIWENRPTSRDGKEFEFTNDDEFGKVAVIPISSIEGYDSNNQPTRIGFIVREGGWDAGREPGGDRFIDLTQASNNEVHIYLISGDETIYTKREDADITPQFSSATLTSFSSLNFTITEPVDNIDTFKESMYVKENGVDFGIEEISFNEDKKSGTVKLNNDITFENDYVLGSTNFIKDRTILKTMLFSSAEFEQLYTYTGADLGAIYSAQKTKFRLWAPTATNVSVVLYETGDYRNGSILDAVVPSDLIEEIHMSRSEKGTWYLEVSRDLDGVYYTYKVTFGNRSIEAVDPYAKAVGVNGHRGMVVNLDSTNPSKWLETKPEFVVFNDAIIYELHIRDISIHNSANIQNKGKYLGLIEKGTNYNGTKTGLDHLVDLGITHLHLLPTFDHRSIDETNLSTPQFNWGYDPLNFNVPEGSFSSDPFNGKVRINEFKQMVQGLHDANIRVVMDVVYNHLGDAASSSFEKIVPGYYFRYDENGGYSNGSGVGNETASEKAMFRKFMVDSVVYWATEYNIDGFRFDLMALHDIETMNLIRDKLSEIDPSILVYGEGWTGGTSPLPENKQALRTSVSKMPNIAVFNDISRDGIKGSVFDNANKGFVQGATGRNQEVMFGIVGGIEHPDTEKVWATSPNQIINYVEAHDNLTLWDKLSLSISGANNNKLTNIHKQAAAIVLTSQGIPFIHAGQDFLRSKPDGGSYNHNSYNAPDRVNQLRWDYKHNNSPVYDYYKGLIELRKSHPAFRMQNPEDIRTKLRFFDTKNNNIIGYTIKGAQGDEWNNIVVLFNSNQTGNYFVTLPEEGTYNIVVDLARAGTETIRTITGKTVEIRPNEAIVMYETAPVVDNDNNQDKDNNAWILITGISLGVVLLGGAAFYFIKKRS